MKASGIARNLDELGRIVIPMEIRKRLEIKPGDPIEIMVEGSSIILKKHTQVCTFCGSGEDLTEFLGKSVCLSCKRSLAK